MALPGGLAIAQPILYFPSLFDLGIRGPLAAVVTGIDATAGTIDLTVFPPGRDPVFRVGVKYIADILAWDKFFLLTTDTLPACGTEKSGVVITFPYFGGFQIDWTNPGTFAGTAIYYRVNGTTDWVPVSEGQGEYNSTETQFIFANGLVMGETYDFLIQNICINSIASAGVIVTDTVGGAP